MALLFQLPGWNPTFTCEFNNDVQGDGEKQSHFEEDGSNTSIFNKEENSHDLFGIYETLEKLDKEDRENKNKIIITRAISRGIFGIIFRKLIKKIPSTSTTPLLVGLNLFQRICRNPIRSRNYLLVRWQQMVIF